MKLLTNVRVLTMGPAKPSARSVTVVDGRVVALDGVAASGARAVDCGGGVLVPGFVDPHVHLLAAAAALRSVDCSPRAVRSIRDIQQRIGGAADAGGGWVRATGYDETALAEGRHPTRWDLDAVAPERPVRLLHRGGHAMVLNSMALALAGIHSGSEEPPGGVIDRRVGDGEPTGLLIDMDQAVEPHVPALPVTELIEGMRELSEAFVRGGVTAVQDMTHRNDDDRLALLDRVCDAAAFRPHRLAPAMRPGVMGAGPIKLMLAEAGGVTRAQADQLRRAVDDAHAAGRQAAVHAVTAPAVRAALDAFEAALRRHPRGDHRHRIEHASVCPPELAERAARLGVLVVSNPAFLVESGERYLRTVPAGDLPHLYAAGALAAAGVVVAAGSDTPVAAPAPVAAMTAAIDRSSAEGRSLPGRGASVETALALVTRSAAFAAFAEGEHGAIAPGRRADLVLLDALPGAGRRPRVWWTLLGGEPAYIAGGAPPYAVGAPDGVRR
jgi:predicted amidohydrolase YtcJ